MYQELPYREAKRIIDEIDREVQKEMAKEKVMEKLVEDFRASEDSVTAAQQLSAAYLLFTLGNQYAESATDIMLKYHLVKKKVKTTANNLMQSFDAFDKEMQTMVTRGENALAFCNDAETLREIIDVFLSESIDVERGPYFKPKLFLPLKKQ